MAESETDCCIVGGGPAGAMLALLLVRQGISVTLLEAHADFNRDFRGDTVHPSTLALMEELGLLEALLRLPHTRHDVMTLSTPQGAAPYIDTRSLSGKYRHWLRMPQARFLEFLTAEASRYPNFRLLMAARVEALIECDGVVRGIRYRGADGVHELQAQLTVGADGRFSKVRDLARIARTRSAQPIDILWFVMPTSVSDPVTAGGLYVQHGGLAFIRNRGDHWQIAYLLPKGGYQQLRADGIDVLRSSLRRLLPWLTDRLPLLTDWTQTTLLSVESSRARRWYRPGLLLIGDAAHVMSPVGGVGINMAIQDAVVAANVLGPRLKSSSVRVRVLAAIQRRRERVTRLVQVLQDLLLEYVVGLADTSNSARWRALRVVHSFPPFVSLRTRLFAFGGFAPEHLN